MSSRHPPRPRLPVPAPPAKPAAPPDLGPRVPARPVIPGTRKRIGALALAAGRHQGGPGAARSGRVRV